MLLDTNELPDGQALAADLCIIGAGAAGITIVQELIASGIDVLLLRAGGLKAEKATQAMCTLRAYGRHHLGTARMGTGPRFSAANADCRVHETNNMYVAGAAAFATSSQANPTLAVVALALRLADHLRMQHRR